MSIGSIVYDFVQTQEVSSDFLKLFLKILLGAEEMDHIFITFSLWFSNM